MQFIELLFKLLNGEKDVIDVITGAPFAFILFLAVGFCAGYYWRRNKFADEKEHLMRRIVNCDDRIKSLKEQVALEKSKQEFSVFERRGDHKLRTVLVFVESPDLSPDE